MPINTQIDTRTPHLKEQYLDRASRDLSTKEKPVNFFSGEALKMSFIRLAADAANLKGDDRANFAKLLASTPGWFGSGNPSACRQAYAKKENTVKGMADYTNW
jgi:hypothetical protein